MNKVNNTSVNTGNENLDKLRRIFPQFIRENKIDFDALKKFFLDEEIVAGEEKYGLNWAGKSNAFKLIRTPSVGTLTPLEKEGKDWDKTENLFIEGDNLEVLKLLQKHYREKIKMIYIDPPYNTGKDFIYKDNYTENISDYYEKTGQSKNGIKMTTNPESAGRYHSDWLTMMYPRLFLARNLLKEDGIIFISIDDNEVANLRLIMDEIFGEENFVGDFIWRKKEGGGQADDYFVTEHEFILVYKKSDEFKWIDKIIPDNETKYNKIDTNGKFTAVKLSKWGNTARKEDRPSMYFPIKSPDSNNVFPIAPDGNDGRWRVGKVRMQLLIMNDLIYWEKKNNQWIPYEKIYYSDDIKKKLKDRSILLDLATTATGTNTLTDLFGKKDLFENPKPVELIQSFMENNTKEEDIVLDFFAGSGTTAQAVVELNVEDEGNRKWICVQLPEATDEKSEAYKAGYKTIAEIARERIRRVGKKIGKGDIGFKSLALTKSNYRQWNILTNKDDEQKLKKQMKLFLEKPLVDSYDEKSVVYEILLKEGYDLNSKVTQGKSGNMKYWQVVDGDKKLLVTFEKKVTKDQVESLKLSEEDTFVCLDFALDDTTKINIGRNLNVKVI